MDKKLFDELVGSVKETSKIKRGQKRARCTSVRRRNVTASTLAEYAKKETVKWRRW